MSLEGTEVTVKLAGSGAKQLAILLYAILREQTKTKGKTRLANMLRSGKELKVFAVKDGDLKQFCREAKKYGVLYCVLKDRDATDGITDIMVRAEDASKVNRIFEHFDLSTVDMASVKQEIERDREEKAGEDIPAPEQDKDAFLDELLAPPPEQEGQPPAPERTTPEQDKDDFLSEVLGDAKEGGQPENPTGGRTAKSRQSEPISKPKEQAAPGISDPQGRSPSSIRRELDEIKAEQKAKAAEVDRLFERIYEDNVSGKLTDDRFMKMSQRYDEEQRQLKKDIEELQRQCDKDDDRAYCKDQFLKVVRKFMEMKTLTPTILHELVERIDVY